MKQILLWLIISLFLTQAVHAKRKHRIFTDFKYGYLEPEGADNGRLVGLATGWRLDNRLFWGFELYYFNASFRKTSRVDSIVRGILIKNKTLELEFQTTIIPLFFILDYQAPLRRRSSFLLRASGGLGWLLLWNKERNYIEGGVEQTRLFHGPAYQMTAGLGLQISRSGVVFADLFYNDSRATRGGKDHKDGLPSWQQIDLMGFGIKIGIRIAGLGIR